MSQPMIRLLGVSKTFPGQSSPAVSELNGKVENEGLDPDAVAKDWLTSNGFLDN